MLTLPASPARACFEPASINAYLVAQDGNDRGPGTPDAPFATIARALAAMRDSNVRTTFVRDGRYRLTETLALDHRDDGVSIIACPQAFPTIDAAAPISPMVSMTGVKRVTWQGFDLVGDGDAEAIRLTGSTAVQLRDNRLSRHNAAIVLEQSVDSVIAHNTIRDSGAAGIELKDRSDRNLIADNLVDGTRTDATHGGGIFLHGASGNRILRNQVQHADGAGIAVSNWDARTINENNLIAENTVTDVNRHSEDSGAIYLLGRSHVDTRTCVLRNVIDGTGAGEAAHTIGIYLDDSVSGVLVLGNELRRVGTHAFEVHGGDDVRIEDNVLDLRAGSANAVLFQAAPADTGPTNTMRGNVFRRNIVVFDGVERTPFSFLDGGRPAIEANVYEIPQAWSSDGDAYGTAPVFADVARSARVDMLFRVWTRSAMACG